MALNTNHRRRLLATFTYVDDILDAIDHVLISARSRRAFPRFVADVPPEHAQALLQHVATFRENLLAALAELGIEPNPPSSSAAQALEAHLAAAEIALDDSRAAVMRGYGDMTAEDAAVIERTTTALKHRLEHIRALLSGFPRAAHVPSPGSSPSTD